jgi:hypothetical protein
MQHPDPSRHPDPARPDDPLIPNPGDPYPGHPDPAYPSKDHPAQRQASDTNKSSLHRQQGGAMQRDRTDRIRPSQQVAQGADRSQQQSDMAGGSPFGDPSPGDENPRDVPPRGAPSAAPTSRKPRKRKGSRQQMGQGAKSEQPQQSGGDAGPFGDPSPGDENPRVVPPRGSQRS